MCWIVLTGTVRHLQVVHQVSPIADRPYWWVFQACRWEAPNNEGSQSQHELAKHQYERDAKENRTPSSTGAGTAKRRRPQHEGTCPPHDSNSARTCIVLYLTKRKKQRLRRDPAPNLHPPRIASRSSAVKTVPTSALTIALRRAPWISVMATQCYWALLASTRDPKQVCTASPHTTGGERPPSWISRHDQQGSHLALTLLKFVLF